MRLVDRDRSVAANSKSANVLEGKAGRLITVASHVRISASAVAVGILMSAQLATMGMVQTALDDQEISNSNRYPQIPEDYVTEFPVTPSGGGDELIIFLRNRTGAAILATTVVDITPV